MHKTGNKIIGKIQTIIQSKKTKKKQSNKSIS